jgi:hypothetical protein
MVGMNEPKKTPSKLVGWGFSLNTLWWLVLCKQFSAISRSTITLPLLPTAVHMLFSHYGQFVFMLSIRKAIVSTSSVCRGGHSYFLIPATPHICTQ